MGLTGWGFAAMLIVVTVALPVVLVWSGRRTGRRAARTRWGAVGQWGGILLAQIAAIVTAAVLVNNWMLFYPTWGDLLGKPEQAAIDVNDPPPGPNQLAPAGEPAPAAPEATTATITKTEATLSGGRLITLAVHGHASKARADVLVWLPPDYDTALAGQQLPVLYFMPGQPGSPQGLYQQYDFDTTTAKLIGEHKIKPFIGVFPPLMVDPPKNTECLDQPGGPQTQTWLAVDVREAIAAQFRTVRDPAGWNLAGYSTGGYCAANLLLNHRDKFGAAAALGGYYHAWSDQTTGDLFGGNAEAKKSADLVQRLKTDNPQPTKLLMVSSKGDPSSWGGPRGDGDAKEAIEAAKRWPGTASLVLDKGGHGYRTYLTSFSDALVWLAKTNGL